jgi:hypothetical protein
MIFEDFAKKKFGDYVSLVQFSEGKTHLNSVRESSLPPYIVNFFECSLKNKPAIITKDEFENILNRAVIFNINYVIKPRGTLLKFLFGEVETRPAGYIREKLRYFQFYSYYIDQIEDFISINQPVTISVNQIEMLINEVNKRILDEISNLSNGDSRRLNLIKLLYVFFLDLVKNNPINIKLPKKILSVFFRDRGFTEIQQRIDRFFSNEVFIQEAIELIKPVHKKTEKAEEEIDEKRVKEILTKVKTNLISAESSNKDIKVALETAGDVPAPEEIINVENLQEIKTIRKSELFPESVIEDSREAKTDDEIYSEDLILESKLDEAVTAETDSEQEKKEILFNELFCEESYRKKILKKIFRGDDTAFKEFVCSLLEAANWKQASLKIDEFFINNNVDYFSEEAVKFVDVLDFYFKNHPAAGLSKNKEK